MLREVTGILVLTASCLVMSPAVSAADPVVGTPLKVVLLGDSYSAGNGARTASDERDYYGPEGCLRSGSNWAEQYVESLRTQGYLVTFVNRACSGAVTDNMVSPRSMGTEDGTYSPGVSFADLSAAQEALEQADPCNTHRHPDEEYWTYEATELLFGSIVEFTCERFLIRQIDAIGPDTDLVLFTIGGNDIGFEEIVKRCFAPSFRSPGDCEDEVATARNALGDVGLAVKDMIDDLRTERGLRSDARVVLGGYPLLALDNDYGLSKYGCTVAFPNPFPNCAWHRAYDAADEVRELGLDGDASQVDVVSDANVGHPGQLIHLAGVPLLFDGHEPNGAVWDTNPNRWIWEMFETSLNYKLEWYHMNPAGHESYASHLAQFGAFGAGSQRTGGDIDVVFALDTTGSMGGVIDEMSASIVDIAEDLAQVTTSARFALVTFRDHPEWTGDATDYPSRLDQAFTSNPADLQSALALQVADGGGDGPESAYSGVMTALDQPWRPGVKKVVIALTDNYPHDPEPETGYVAQDVIDRAFEVDPAQIYLVDAGSTGDGALADVADASGGEVIDLDVVVDVAAAVEEAIQISLDKPHAWIDRPYVAQVGATLELNASGSYAVDGNLVEYEWDLDGDGTYEITDDVPILTHTFNSLYDGMIALRVTDDQGRSSVATTHLGITDDGDEIDSVDDNCPLDDNQDQADEDGDLIGDACDPTPGLLLPELDGVMEGPGDYVSSVRARLPDLYWRLAEPNGTTAENSTFPENVGVYVGGPSLAQPSAVSVTGDFGLTLDGSNDNVAQDSSIEPPALFTEEAWFKTTTTSGGGILGFGASKTGNSSSSDRHIYMTNPGKLRFGVQPSSGMSVIESPESYNDGVWHHVVGTLGTTGQKLYVDGIQVASSATTGAREYPYEGYWRVGGDSLVGWSQRPASDYFQGSVDEIAVYPRVLTPEQIAMNYYFGITGATGNQPAIAAFDSTENQLEVAFDSQDSLDPDGTIASYAWDFGDGSNSVSANPTHTYAAAGTYTVTLMVTDDDGATDTVAHDVSVVNVPTPIPYASDAFERTVVDGWGTADLGGAWIRQGSAALFNVNGGSGSMTMSTPGSGISMRSPASSLDSDVSVAYSLATIGNGSGTYVELGSRASSSTTTNYRVLANISATGRVRLQLKQVVSGAETVIAGPILLPPDVAVTTSNQLRIRFQTQGTSPTTLRARAWLAGTTEPSTWQITVTNSHPDLQTAGGYVVRSYLSSSATNGPVTARFDQFLAQSLV